MPHFRDRHLEPLARKALRFSPILTLLGHRQVGKTTLAQRLGERYFSLDLRSVLESCERDPEAFLEGNRARPLVLDECQLSPALFPALKDHVRRHPGPGRFLLTGSVRFSSRRAIRESLTGRMISWELLPMDLSEAHGFALPGAVPKLIRSKSVEVDLEPPLSVTEAIFENALAKGGLPGIFAIRDPTLLRQRFETQIETLLERDLRLLLQTTLGYRALRELLATLADRQGEPLELSSLSRATRISTPALKRLLSALEAMFLIRIVPAEGGERKPILYFEDQGEAHHLRRKPASEIQRLGFFLFSQLRTQWTYRPELGLRLTEFRTRGGAYVPLALHSPSGSLGILPVLEENPSPQALGSARAFQRAYRGAKILFAHRGRTDACLSDSQRTLPVSKLFAP